jgi:hypothetical protein
MALIRLEIPAIDRAALPKTELCVEQAEQCDSKKLYYALAYVAMHVFRQQTRIYHMLDRMHFLDLT